ncbi:hypothetical protein O181_066575 [Austropuccinia psidii MF-1]|uniref:Glutaredoxin domain-containing protein n=1 Tax=Austropuccinia psidii MF-1 TaxID=1389203 RepID=A0A9Q3EP93_9BASI|nr:hypothetical protein [Austropuccinia psidii MF-1]
MSQFTQKIQELIDQNDLVVFAKSTCPYCVKAIETLNQLGHPPLVIQLDQIDNGTQLHQALKTKTNQNTVPAIFIKQELIGGNSDLQELNNKGELLKKFN